MEKLRHVEVKQLALWPGTSRTGMEATGSPTPESIVPPKPLACPQLPLSLVRGRPVIAASQGASEIMCGKALGKLQRAL